MTDIMQDFKNRRFMVAPSYISRELPEPVYGHMIVLTDFSYWTEHIDDLLLWCGEHDCTVKGMTVDIPNDPTLTLFCLRWSG
jgi:hypothetical protein